jgi:protein farnesyltransferase/geranylgeranyltransferase type-1 subunit alpha
MLTGKANSVFRYAKSAIRLAPQNQSPWNYIRGLQRQAKGPAAISHESLKSFAQEFASIEQPDHVRSSHALDLLADVYAAEEGKKEEAAKALDLLADRYDPVRANYWNYRKSRLGASVAASA